MLVSILEDPLVTYGLGGLILIVLLFFVVWGSINVSYDAKKKKLKIGKEVKDVEVEEEQHKRNLTEMDRVDEKNSQLVRTLFTLHESQQSRIQSLEESYKDLVKTSLESQGKYTSLADAHKKCEEAHRLCEERTGRLESEVASLKAKLP